MCRSCVSVAREAGTHAPMTISLVYRAQTPADARHFVRDALMNAPAVAVDVAELLTSEIVTNAMVHARLPSAVIGLVDLGDGVRIEVHDTSADLPRLDPSTDPVEPGGYGLAIVDQMASRWGVDQRAEGKVVWFELTLFDRALADQGAVSR